MTVDLAKQRTLRSALGKSFGKHREPRIRVVKGTRRGKWTVLELRRTRPAAMRGARRRRDKEGELRPLRVAEVKKWNRWAIICAIEPATLRID